MKRFLAAALLAVTLALPAAAQSSGSAMRYYGVNTKAADCSGITYNEVARAASYSSRWAVRCLLDKRVADANGGVPNGGVWNAYGSTLNWLHASGITVLPMIGWTNANGSWHRPSDAERTAFQDFTYWSVSALDYSAQQYGMAWSNVVEVWNEPNCMTGTAPGPGSCKFGGFSSLSDYKASAFDPAFTGARNRDADVNVLVGGLGFGTQDTNGFNDGSNWAIVWEQRGYGLAAGFSIHPYGYTSPHDPYPRMPTSNQSAGNSNDEFRRVCDSANRSVLTTEVGRRTDWGSNPEQAQYNYLNDINNYQGWHAKGLFNYLSIDQDSTGTGSAGVLTVGNGAKQAFGLWDYLGRNGWQWAGDLGANCVI